LVGILDSGWNRQIPYPQTDRDFTHYSRKLTQRF
jgi:hypothetical protein